MRIAVTGGSGKLGRHVVARLREGGHDVVNLDGSGEGDACDGDLDGDGVANDVDNCPFEPNPGQGDFDGDGVSNGTDSAPSDPCVPNANALACASGDFDGDGYADLAVGVPKEGVGSAPSAGVVQVLYGG